MIFETLKWATFIYITNSPGVKYVSRSFISLSYYIYGYMGYGV